MVARGLRDYVLTDWQSLRGAFRGAREDEDNREFARATEAFQESFNFCFTCRRSVCPDCWNEAEGGCLSCQPLPEQAAWAIDPVLETPDVSDGIRTRTLSPDVAEWLGDLAGNGGAADPVADVIAPAAPVEAVETAEMAAVAEIQATEGVGAAVNRPAEEVAPVEAVASPTPVAAPRARGERRQQAEGARRSRRRSAAADAPAGGPADSEHRIAFEPGVPKAVNRTVEEPFARWPRPTPWLERPLHVHGQLEGSHATTLQRRGIPVMARVWELEAPSDDAMPWLGPVLSRAVESPTFAALPEEALPPEPDDEPLDGDAVCHNCGTPVSPRGRFCSRCHLQVTRRSGRTSAFDGVAAARQ